MATIKVQLSDSQNGFGSKEFHLDATVTTVADAQTAYTALLAAWPGVSDAGMDNATVSFPLTGSTPALTGSNLDEGARIRLGMATGVGDENYRIPAPAKTAGVLDYIVGGAVQVANAAVVAFFDLFEATGDFRIGINSLRAVDTVKSGYLEKP